MKQDKIPQNASEVKEMESILRFISESKFEKFFKPLSFLAKKVRDSKGELDLQLRKDYLNVYYKGNSLAKVNVMADHFRIEVHSEFKLAKAVDNDSKGRFPENTINTEGRYHSIQINDPILFEKFFQDKIVKALASEIKTVNNGEEINFEQSLITDNIENERFIIIDRQVAGGGIPGKLDLLGLKLMESGKYCLVVLEVKLGNNPELKNDVAGQLERYVKAIERNFVEFKNCYEKNYSQKYELGLFGPNYPKNIVIEEGVIGKIIVGSYSGIASEQLKILYEKYPYLVSSNTVVSMFHDLASKI